MTQPWYVNPEWWQVILIVAGTAIAARAFLAERAAVRLTQRADILILAVTFESQHRTRGGHLPLASAEISFRFKNYGPTRAVDVKSAGLIYITAAGSLDERKAVTSEGERHWGVVASGDEFVVTMPPLGDLLPEDVLNQISNGRVGLHYEFGVLYTDVFKKRHQTWNSGTYDAAGAFHAFRRHTQNAN